MPTFIVSYDITNGSAPAELVNKIKSYPKWGHVLANLWVIVTDQTATEIRGELKTHLTEEDRLIVVKSANAGAWHNSICKNQWLLDNL